MYPGTKEEGEYIEALEVIDGKIEEFKKRIKEEASDKTSHFKKELQGKTIDEIYEKVMSGICFSLIKVYRKKTDCFLDRIKDILFQNLLDLGF